MERQEVFKIPVERRFWAELLSYMPPQTRFMSKEHELVLWTLGGALHFFPERRQLRGVIVRPAGHNRRKDDQIEEIEWDE